MAENWLCTVKGREKRMERGRGGGGGEDQIRESRHFEDARPKVRSLAMLHDDQDYYTFFM